MQTTETAVRLPINQFWPSLELLLKERRPEKTTKMLNRLMRE
jgi:hypothetical protein